MSKLPNDPQFMKNFAIIYPRLSANIVSIDLNTLGKVIADILYKLTGHHDTVEVSIASETTKKTKSWPVLYINISDTVVKKKIAIGV